MPPSPAPFHYPPFHSWAGVNGINSFACVGVLFLAADCTARTARQLTHLYLTNVKCIFWWTPLCTPSPHPWIYGLLLCCCLIMHFSKNIPSMSDKLNYYICWLAGRHVNTPWKIAHFLCFPCNFKSEWDAFKKCSQQ